MMLSGRVNAIIIVATLLFSDQPVLAFSPKILSSVVNVLPVWKNFPINKEERIRRLEEPEGTAVAIKPGGYLVTNFHGLKVSIQTMK